MRLRHSAPCIPCVRFAPRPLRFAKGRGKRIDLFFSGFPRAGAVHNLTCHGFTVRSRAPPRCPAPLDSGFRRNDGRCAKYPLREAKKARASEVMLSWDFMEPRISFITLGVDDLPRSVEFYRDGLGLPLFDENTESIAFFRTEDTWLALYPRAALADDVGIDTEGSGFSGVTLAHNVRSREEVDTMLAVAVAAGAKLVKPAEDVFWGGYSGYFSDPDGYLWEIAWNPHFWIE